MPQSQQTQNHFAFHGTVTVGTYLVPYTRQGSLLTCETLHDDRDMLEKVAKALCVTLCSQVAYSTVLGYGVNIYRSQASVSEWAGMCIVSIVPVKVPIGFGLAARGECEHSWETKQLFISSYQVCTKCGVEK